MKTKNLKTSKILKYCFLSLLLFTSIYTSAIITFIRGYNEGPIIFIFSLLFDVISLIYLIIIIKTKDDLKTKNRIKELMIIGSIIYLISTIIFMYGHYREIFNYSYYDNNYYNDSYYREYYDDFAKFELLQKTIVSSYFPIFFLSSISIALLFVSRIFSKKRTISNFLFLISSIMTLITSILRSGNFNLSTQDFLIDIAYILYSIALLLLVFYILTTNSSSPLTQEIDVLQKEVKISQTSNITSKHKKDEYEDDLTESYDYRSEND